MSPRTAPNRDANEAELVKLWRRVHASWQSLDLRDGPDGIVGFRGVNYLVEIKDGKKVPSKRRLRPGQKRWHARWRGQIAVIENADDALALLGLDSRQTTV